MNGLLSMRLLLSLLVSPNSLWHRHFPATQQGSLGHERPFKTPGPEVVLVAPTLGPPATQGVQLAPRSTPRESPRQDRRRFHPLWHPDVLAGRAVAQRPRIARGPFPQGRPPNRTCDGNMHRRRPAIPAPQPVDEFTLGDTFTQASDPSGIPLVECCCWLPRLPGSRD